jgi:hypothetical protein
MPDVVPITAGSGTGIDTREVTFNLTGTVAKNATTTVTGTGSAFTSQLVSGDVIRIPGGTSTEDRIVNVITTDTSLTVTVAFTTTASGQTGQRIAQRQIVQTGFASTAAVTSVASSATNVTLLSSSANRIGMTVYNDSTAVLYLKYGTVASLTSFTVQMGPAAYWEMAQPIYTGQIDGIWSAANGNARITELTP